MENKVGFCTGIDFIFFMEVFLLILAPIPYLKMTFVNEMNVGPHKETDKNIVKDRTQFLTDYIFAVMFFRIGFVFKVLFNQSGYKT